MLLITTLAEYQTAFWEAVAHEAVRTGQEVGFVSFDDRSTEQLRKSGFRVWDAPARPQPVTEAEFLAALDQFDITNANHWLTHERVAFGTRDGETLRAKLVAYLRLVDGACSELLREGKHVTLVQELGGFVSVVASMFAARRHGIDNWFIEPAFFRGRMFFIRNSFAAPRVQIDPGIEPSDVVRRYLADTLAARSIVIPIKDKHQYTTAFRKVFNRKNGRRLVQKLIDKHMLGKHQEFGHIGKYVRQHLGMILSGMRLKKAYAQLADVGRFVYYPLHVPGDMALTLRSPQYLDQLALVDFLARNVPPTHKIAIKEHPAMVGLVDVPRLQALMKRYDNIVLLNPSINNFEVLGATDAVVSVNSKSGAEAGLLGKPTLVLGDAFYKGSPIVTSVDALSDVPAMLARAVATREAASTEETRLAYFDAVWRACSPGELYVCDAANVRTFTKSMVDALAEPPREATPA